MTHTFVPHLRRIAWSRTPVRPVSRLRDRLVALRSAFATQRERKRLRWELKQMAKANSHLIDDIGLTRRQVEAEIARLPFWQR